MKRVLITVSFSRLALFAVIAALGLCLFRGLLNESQPDGCSLLCSSGFE